MWKSIKKYTDIKFERTEDGIAKVTINRPKVRNAFRPETVHELQDAFSIIREDGSIGVAILTGEGKEAFCSGGDQKVRGQAGYVGSDGVPRLNVLDLQKQIRFLPKPVVAMVAGYAIGGGHVLHVVCDLTIAADNAIFGQTGPKVGSFDGGLGSSYLARIVGQKKAREIWFLCRQYNAKQALEMGLVNAVVPEGSFGNIAIQRAVTARNNNPPNLANEAQNVVSLLQIHEGMKMEPSFTIPRDCYGVQLIPLGGCCFTQANLQDISNIFQEMALELSR